MDRKIPITVLVQTRNEEAGILACIEGLSSFDEVIVVDSNSSDRTCEIAASAGAKIVEFTWNGDYPKKKQWELDNVFTRNEWILFIDADEIPNDHLLSSINGIDFENISHVAAFDLKLDYVFNGKILKHGHKVVKRALVHRNRVKFPTINDLASPGMGELEGHYQPEAFGDVNALDGAILHDDKDPIGTWFERHNRYSDWEAYLRINPETKRQIAIYRSKQGRLFDRVPLKPLVFFLYAYLFKQGFRDGRNGFDYAFALSSYYWQIELKTSYMARVNREKN